MESKQLCPKWQQLLVAYSWKRWSTLPKREASVKMGQFQGQWLKLFPLDLQSAWSSKGCQGLYSKPHLLNRKRDAFKMMRFQNSGSSWNFWRIFCCVLFVQPEVSHIIHMDLKLLLSTLIRVVQAQHNWKGRGWQDSLGSWDDSLIFHLSWTWF